MIAIRRHSAAFAAWRDCVEATYRHLRQHRDRDRAQTLLHGSVNQCLDQLQHDISSIWTGGVRGLVLGGVGATPGLIAHGGAGAELTAAGSVASLLAGLAWGHHEKRHQRHAIRAIEKHFVYLTKHLPHPSRITGSRKRARSLARDTVRGRLDLEQFVVEPVLVSRELSRTNGSGERARHLD